MRTVPIHSTDVGNGVRIAYRHWRGRGLGTIVFIHGLGATQEQFAADAEYFAAAGFDCLTVDLRAHGRSSTPAALNREAFTVDAFASDIARIIANKASSPVHLVGNSLGGLVALALIAATPASYRSITTFGTAYRLHFPPGLPTLQYFVGRLMGRNRLAKIVAKNEGHSEEASMLLLRMYRTIDLKVMYLAQQNLRVYDYTHVPAIFDGYIAVIRGEHDRGINRQLPKSLAVLEQRANFKLHEITGAGHFANLDRPQDFRRILLTSLEKLS
ncbi:alpha/beta fold hydrolase [Aliiroseovarius sp. 2305UL8-7]|uniref:alpha/beta fold hydrolase n=1 Tax=Aliiroseovarius conchicola TaxID=3121637 RepID=UPI003528BA31